MYVIVDSNGKMREATTWKELREIKGCQVYRTTGHPCSCPLCTGERYDRNIYKRETQRRLHEELNV